MSWLWQTRRDPLRGYHTDRQTGRGVTRRSKIVDVMIRLPAVVEAESFLAHGARDRAMGRWRPMACVPLSLSGLLRKTLDAHHIEYEESAPNCANNAPVTPATTNVVDASRHMSVKPRLLPNDRGTSAGVPTFDRSPGPRYG